MSSPPSTDRARDFVRELESYWKFQSIHPDANPEQKLSLFLRDAYGGRKRVNHVTVFDSNSLLVTFADVSGVSIIQIEQCSFAVCREPKPKESPSERPPNVIPFDPFQLKTVILP